MLVPSVRVCPEAVKDDRMWARVGAASPREKKEDGKDDLRLRIEEVEQFGMREMSDGEMGLKGR